MSELAPGFFKHNSAPTEEATNYATSLGLVSMETLSTFGRKDNNLSFISIVDGVAGHDSFFASL